MESLTRPRIVHAHPLFFAFHTTLEATQGQILSQFLTDATSRR